MPVWDFLMWNASSCKLKLEIVQACEKFPVHLFGIEFEL